MYRGGFYSKRFKKIEVGLCDFMTITDMVLGPKAG